MTSIGFWHERTKSRDALYAKLGWRLVVWEARLSKEARNL